MKNNKKRGQGIAEYAGAIAVAAAIIVMVIASVPTEIKTLMSAAVAKVTAALTPA